MLPLSDGIPARRFPFINVALIAANFAVWILYGYRTSARPCTTRRSTPAP
jgi:hypothetical protein